MDLRPERFHRITLAIALAAWAVPSAAQQSGVYDFGHARKLIDSVMKADRIPSMAVAVAKGDRILWEVGVGFADVERNVPSNAHTPYSLASISKPFTATGIMLLVQQQLVRLRAPVNHYLGGARVVAREGSADAVTLERLLTHTAGLPLHYQFFYEDAGYTRPPMDSTIRRYGVAVYPPGEAFQYSNLGYGILDYVISRKSGMSYADFMRRSVFMPLGLTNTRVGLAPGPMNHAAQRYDADNKPIPYYTFDHPGASEIYSSAHDLVRFGMYHLSAKFPGQRQILAKETVSEMQRDVAVEAPGLMRGLGWSIRTINGVRRVSHSGGMPGVSTFLALYPEEQVVVVVLLNKLVRRATDAVLTELSATVMPRFATALRAQRAAPAPPPTPSVDVARLAELQGQWRGFIYTYADSVPSALTISAADAPQLSVHGSVPVALTSLSLEQGILTGRANLQLGAPDFVRHPHQTVVWLRRNERSLTGYAAAEATGPRAYYALSSYIKLQRVPR
jgi:CubicO group peptidase (beta-lactamase class C family)